MMRSRRCVCVADDPEAVRYFRIKSFNLMHRQHFAVGAHGGERRHQLVRDVGQQQTARAV